VPTTGALETYVEQPMTPTRRHAPLHAVDRIGEDAVLFEVWREGACHRFKTWRQLESFLDPGDLVDLTYTDGRRGCAEAIEWGDPSWPDSWRRITLRAWQEA
jgi:hypothetical protein